jgi:hypothetical protein
MMWIFDAWLLCVAIVLEMIDRAPTIDDDLHAELPRSSWRGCNRPRREFFPLR